VEQETLFTASKWDILTELRKQDRSPKQLAEILNTSVANVSQQLRLLAMAGLVNSERVSNRGRGQPRVLYSLSGDHSYLIATAREFVDKKFHTLTERNKVVLRIWFLDDDSVHYFLEKAFWHLDDHIGDDDALVYHKGSRVDLTLVTTEDIPDDVGNFTVANPDGVEHDITITTVPPAEFTPSDTQYVLYDPNGIASTE
jgi:DNA-binding transcriptional ArsR family regulator